MPKSDPLDRVVTVRDLSEAMQAARVKHGVASVRGLVEALTGPQKTDFVRVRFGSSINSYVYKVHEQPARRVQVGDLVTAPASSMSTQPQVARVIEIDVPTPRISKRRCVAISPDDAARIEAALGTVLPRP